MRLIPRNGDVADQWPGGLQVERIFGVIRGWVIRFLDFVPSPVLVVFVVFVVFVVSVEGWGIAEVTLVFVVFVEVWGIAEVARVFALTLVGIGPVS